MANLDWPNSRNIKHALQMVNGLRKYEYDISQQEAVVGGGLCLNFEWDEWEGKGGKRGVGSCSKGSLINDVMQHRGEGYPILCGNVQRYS